ncbi:spermidine/putrescine transport system substrate-binding protein [Rhizobiales bacterium GAS191]|nr:spermidine/putrescine transport system substrate-binding protein [Rhizobiales bacterium GAS191]
MTAHFSRRTFHVLFGSALGTGLLATAVPRRAAAATTEITVLNWKGYGTDEAFALKAFAEATGIAVKHDYFNAEAEMLTKLRTNPGAYDVVLINSARTQQAQAEGLIDVVDFGTVANAKDLEAPLKDHPNLQIGGKPYGVAWVWGMNSLGVRHAKVTEAQSWAIFSDPKYKGRLALFDDSTTEVGIGALLTGQDINNPKDLKAVTAALKAMKPNVKLIWSSEDEWNKAFAADAFDISVYWSGAAARSAKLHKLPVDFVVPNEGAIGWLDSLSVPASSKKKEAALQFINYMIDPKFYVTWATQAGAPASANAVAMSQLPVDDLNRQIHKSEYLSKLQFMSALPDDRRQAFNDVWEEVKAFYAK